MAPQPTTNGGATLNLQPNVISKFKPAKIFKAAVDQPPPPAAGSTAQKQPPNPKSITGLTFDDRGDTLVTAGEDETFRLYNCKTGKQVPSFLFTHKASAILYASTKEDDTIRYHSLHDNKYLAYFRGHKDKVISLEMAPLDDGFMSGSLDKTVRVWDLRTPICRGILSVPAPPIIAHDSSGCVFAVGVNFYAKILLYDKSNYDKAPFLTMNVEDSSLSQISFPARPIHMTSLSFSSNGKYLLVGCSGNAHYIMDAFEGTLLAKLEGHVGLERTSMNAQRNIETSKGISGEEVCWTPDSKYVISGSLDGRILVWDIQNLGSRSDVERHGTFVKVPKLVVLDGHPGPSRCVRFNPRLAMMATAGHELAFWLPDPSGDGDDPTKKR
ncbi:hypothetical protein CVT24_002169 [Panaeolus cyanescens]|uniref:Anaphase-promoting complex subunit 4 WD40 domain-containing protein n=1 Tax=Panaeolus cyanescens TaxID=181874 RepID=A0A409YHW7_9AGAR|nr:hypothetical protein CVT24_002169 [Panaeolus cyanescens]